jgi:hypothetical protein
MVQSPSLSQTPSQSVFHDMQPSAEAACDDVKRERRFVRKLDAVLVTWAFFAYLLKVI